MDRRSFLTLVLSGPLLAAQQSKHMLQMNGYPVDAETPLELLTDYITPADLFFVRSHWNPRMPDLKTWRLVVDGEVENKLSLTLADLRKMPHAEATCGIFLRSASVSESLFSTSPSTTSRHVFRSGMRGFQW